MCGIASSEWELTAQWRSREQGDPTTRAMMEEDIDSGATERSWDKLGRLLGEGLMWGCG